MPHSLRGAHTPAAVATPTDASLIGPGSSIGAWLRRSATGPFLLLARSNVAHVFGAPAVKTYPWLATYRTDCYLAMLASQSSYALMATGRRKELLGAIGELVDELLGGAVTKQYVTVLAVARRMES